MAELPAMPYWGDAYMADTRHLSLEEHGAYHLLLLIAWRSPNRALPNDDRRIAQMLGITSKRWAKIRPAVMAFWMLTEHGWQQKKQLEVWRNASDRRKKCRDSANARWKTKSRKTNDPDDANAYPNADANADATMNHNHTVEAKASTLGRARKRATPKKRPLPEGWNPGAFETGTKCDKIMSEWSLEREQKELEAFRAYHGSRRNLMVDWQQAWATWILNSEKWENGNGAGRNTGNRTTAAATAAFGDPTTWSDEKPF